MTLVMGNCGLRIGEATALRAKDVKDRKITVRASVTKVTGQGYVEDTTKTHRTCWALVPAIVCEDWAWRTYIDGDKGDKERLLFPGRDGGYLTNFEYRRLFDPAAKDIGMERLVPHALRHTCASLAVAAGANVLAVQPLLGHETATMTLDTVGICFRTT